MEKIKLNNQIVLMRKYVKQAKVHLINKLTKQVKLLKNRKGNEMQIQKAKRKAERYLEEITLLKKIKPDCVSKLALSKASNWENILQQKNSALNDRCFAMLANYGAVQKEVEAFYNSNKDLVLKISDLIKQWDEKNKYAKNSSKDKIISSEITEGDKKREKQKTSGSMLNGRKNEMGAFKKDNPFANEEEKIKENENNCSNESNKQTKLSIQQSEISVTDITHECELDSSVDADESSNQIKLHFDHSKNIPETEEPLEKIMDTHASDVNENSEYEDIVVKNTIQKSSLVKNSFETKYSDSDEDLEDKMETTDSDNDEESDQEYLESTGDITESQQHKIKNTDENKNRVTKEGQSSALKFIKKIDDINSPEKKLKVITQFNLDDLQGLDEIPVKNINTANKDQSEEESSEEETVETSQNKMNDPFFLGCGDEEPDDPFFLGCGDEKPVAEKKLLSFSKNKDYLSNKHSAFSDSKASLRDGNTFLERKGNSNEYNYKRNFQKFSKNTHFPRRDSAKFQKERGNFKPFQKNMHVVNNYESKFQLKGKSAFNRTSPRNQGDFKTKDKSSQNHKEKRHKDNGKLAMNNKDKFTVKQQEHKKGITNDKPLHPSWEAKRKQKELIKTSIQGKRIVFEN